VGAGGPGDKAEVHVSEEELGVTTPLAATPSQFKQSKVQEETK
jgi:hypothetical protein